MGPRFPMHPVMYGQYPYPSMHPYMPYYPQGYMPPDNARMQYDNYYTSLNPYAEPWNPNMSVGPRGMFHPHHPPYSSRQTNDSTKCAACTYKLREEQKTREKEHHEHCVHHNHHDSEITTPGVVGKHVTETASAGNQMLLKQPVQQKQYQQQSNQKSSQGYSLQKQTCRDGQEQSYAQVSQTSYSPQTEHQQMSQNYAHKQMSEDGMNYDASETQAWSNNDDEIYQDDNQHQHAQYRRNQGKYQPQDQYEHRTDQYSQQKQQYQQQQEQSKSLKQKDEYQQSSDYHLQQGQYQRQQGQYQRQQGQYCEQSERAHQKQNVCLSDADSKDKVSETVHVC